MAHLPRDWLFESTQQGSQQQKEIEMQRIECTRDSECHKYAYCTQEYRCIPKFPMGSSCSDAVQCLSGTCSHHLIFLPIGKCVPNPQVDTDTVGNICANDNECNSRIHSERFFYCADYQSMNAPQGSGLGLPLSQSSNDRGTCLRLALTGDSCDVDQQCLSGFCDSDLQKCALPRELDNNILIGRGLSNASRKMALVLTGMTALVLFVVSLVYIYQMLRQRWLRAKYLRRGVAVLSDVYVPVRALITPISSSSSSSSSEMTTEMDLPPPPPYHKLDAGNDDDGADYRLAGEEEEQED